MAQNKILIDSNCYFRLAQSIRPLLKTEFGLTKKYCLYIIDGFEGEYLISPRLKSNFYWADQEDYRNNRDRKISRTKNQAKEINTLFDFIWDASQNYEYEGGEISKARKKLPPGPIDCDGLALAKILCIPIVTDDHDMSMLAIEFEIEVWSTMKLLNFMLQEQHIDLIKIKEICHYIQTNRDIPINFSDDKEKYFRGML